MKRRSIYPNKKSYKIAIGIFIGILISGIGVKAVATIYSKNITYDNSKSGITSTNMQGAIDELYTKSRNIKVGDYISMTPTSTSYSIATSLTGYSSSQTINPSELKLWRVIALNGNGIEVTSEYVSSTTVYFSGQTGYQKLVGSLNTIASQYTNSKYVVATRYMGYDNGIKTENITDTSKISSTTAPWTCSTSKSCATVEALGGGDGSSSYDMTLITKALGSWKAYKPGTTTATAYWMATRDYYYGSSTNWSYRTTYITTGGYPTATPLYSRSSGKFTSSSPGNSIRPILTLKSDLTITGGKGTSASPWTLG